MRAVGGERCSVVARARHDDAAGTAPVARRWLLVEHDGPWARAPLDSEPFTGAVGARIAELTATRAAKVLLIRRPGRPAPEDAPRQWFVIDTTTGLATNGVWRTASDIVACAEGIASVAGAAADEAPAITLVCTHGIRDACCAIRGRPIAGQLARELGDEVWECSHLGGHRLSATVLLLPDGACYGYLDQGNAARIVRQHRSGEPSPAHLRGFTKDPQAAQAALVWAMRQDTEHAGELSIGGTLELDDRVTRVEVGNLRPDAAGRWFDVTRVDLEPAQVSCGKGPEPRSGFTIAPAHIG